MKKKLDENGNKFIELKELRNALKTVGVNIPGCDARQIEGEFHKNDTNKDGKLSFEEFSKVIANIKKNIESFKNFKKCTQI